MSLLDGLISYWKLDEVSGNAVDAHGSNDLTDNGSIGTAAGIINTSRTFNGIDQRFSTASNSGLQSENTSFSVQAWARLNVKNVPQVIVGKWNITGIREYRVIYDNTPDRFQFQVSANGSTAVTVTANNFGSISTGAWYHLIGWHDAVADVIGISVSGAENTLAHTAGVFSGTAEFWVGNNQTQTLWTNGRIDEVGFWKRTLSASDRARLYGSGAGRAYDKFGPAGLSTIIASHHAALGI